MNGNVVLYIVSTMAELQETKVFVCWLVGWFIPTRFQPRSPQLCPDAKGWRTADALLNTSAPPHFIIPMVKPAVPSPMRGLASIYDYVHFVSRSDVFACLYVSSNCLPVCMPYSKPHVYNVVSRLVEARLPHALRPLYLQPAPSI